MKEIKADNIVTHKTRGRRTTGLPFYGHFSAYRKTKVSYCCSSSVTTHFVDLCASLRVQGWGLGYSTHQLTGIF